MDNRRGCSEVVAERGSLLHHFTEHAPADREI